MTGSNLHYDILITILPFLDQSSLIQFATVCHSYSQPALRLIWHRPRITRPDQLENFIGCVSRSIQQQQHDDDPELAPPPYHEWVAGLTIAFDAFHPIPLLSTFQSIITHHLPNFSYLSLHHTHAVFSPSVQRYQAKSCLLEFPISAIPGPITTLDRRRNDNNADDDPLPWLDLYFTLGSTLLNLAHISIINSSITGLWLNDDYLCRIALTCPNLRYMRLSGFFSDRGLEHVAEHCHVLETIIFSLPKNFIQSNTITHSSLDRLAMACPNLTKFTCLGQTRIDPDLAEQTFRLYCPRFSCCKFDTSE